MKYKNVAYLNYSINDEKMLEEQKNKIIAFAKKQGDDIDKFYIDIGYTRRNLKRPFYNKMFNDIKNNKVKGCVYIYKLNRITVILNELLPFFKILNCKKVNLKSVMDKKEVINDLMNYVENGNKELTEKIKIAKEIKKRETER